jgi:hypothetical protein
MSKTYPGFAPFCRVHTVRLPASSLGISTCLLLWTDTYTWLTHDLKNTATLLCKNDSYAFTACVFISSFFFQVVWAPGEEVLVTQLLWLNDVLLGSSVRSVGHGYAGTGVIVDPKPADSFSHESAASDDSAVGESGKSTQKFELRDVELVLPKTRRPGRMWPSRKEAVRRRNKKREKTTSCPLPVSSLFSLDGLLVGPSDVTVG